MNAHVSSVLPLYHAYGLIVNVSIFFRNSTATADFVVQLHLLLFSGVRHHLVYLLDMRLSTACTVDDCHIPKICVREFLTEHYAA